MNKEWPIYDSVIYYYDKQIKRGCDLSFLEKELFIYSEQLSLNDWRKIRGVEFWKKYDKLDRYEQARLTLTAIRKYLKK